MAADPISPVFSRITHDISYRLYYPANNIYRLNEVYRARKTNLIIKEWTRSFPFHNPRHRALYTVSYPPTLSNTCFLSTSSLKLCPNPIENVFNFLRDTAFVYIPPPRRLLCPGFTRSESPSPVRGMCYPSPPPFPPQKGKTGGLARSRGFRARTMDTTRPPPSKPATLLARHVVRKRNFLGAFAKLRETDATTRIHRAECGYIRLRKQPRNKTRHVSRFLSFVHYGRSSVSRIQSPNRKSSASVGNRGSSESTFSLELLSLLYIYIYLTFFFVSSREQ